MIIFNEQKESQKPIDPSEHLAKLQEAGYVLQEYLDNLQIDFEADQSLNVVRCFVRVNENDSAGAACSWRLQDPLPPATTIRKSILNTVHRALEHALIATEVE